MSITEKTITVMDIGSAYIRVLCVDVREGMLRYRGHAVVESRGLRKGSIAEIEKCVYPIQRAIGLAEVSAGISIEHATVGVAGAQMRGLNSRGGLSLGSRPREIGREDVRQAVERARAVVLPVDRELLHLLPQEFIVDNQGGIRDPLGVVGTKLEVVVHMVTGPSSASQSVVTVCNRAGINVDATPFETLTAADAVLDGDERELGVCLLDIGADTSELVVFYEGAVAHSGVVPIGGRHFTNDVAVGLRTPLPEAENIKCTYGNAVVPSVPEGNEIEVPAVGERGSRLMPQKLLSEILEPRAHELFEHVRENLRQGGVLEALGAGLVLTGGGAKLQGLPAVAEPILRCPVRVKSPNAISRMPASLAGPEFSTLIGLAMYTHRTQAMLAVPQENGFRARLKALFQIA